MTIQELYDMARTWGLADAHLRICDGMAVNMYPDKSSVTHEHYEVVIDVSTLELIDYDDLHDWRQVLGGPNDCRR